MSDVFAQLLVVQDHDTAVDQLRHRLAHLPAAQRLSSVSAELAAVEAEGAAASATRADLLARQGQLEAELAGTEQRVTEVDKQMRSGLVTAPRDLQAMAGQIEALKRRRSDLEDTELEVMVALEPVEEQVAALEERWAALDKEASELRAVVASESADVEASLEKELASRASAVASIPPDLLERYERLRQRLGGVSAAPLVGSSCGGCHLTLPASEIDRIRKLPPDALVTCDQCGRILVR